MSSCIRQRLYSSFDLCDGADENLAWHGRVIRMRRQAERWGAELHQEDVEFLDVKNSPFTVRSGEREVIY